MTVKVILLQLVLSSFLYSVSAQQPVPAKAGAFYKTAMQNINPKHIAWIKSTAASAVKQQTDTAALRLLAGNYGKSFNLKEADVESLMILLMTQMANDNEEDIKAQMDAMKKNNDEKRKMRDAMEQLKKSKSGISSAVADSFRRIVLINTNNNPKSNIASIKTTTAVKTNISLAEFKSLQAELEQKSDQLSEMSQQQQIQMQMLTDRRKKLAEQLSNLMKKMSATVSDISQNLK